MAGWLIAGGVPAAALVLFVVLLALLDPGAGILRLTFKRARAGPSGGKDSPGTASN